MIVEPRAETGRAVGRTQPHLLDAGQVDVLGEAPCTGNAIVRRPAIVLTEQRRTIPPHEAVQDIAIANVECRDGVEVLVPNPRVVRRRRDERVRPGPELRDLRHGECAGVRLNEAVALILKDRCHLRGVGDLAAEVPDAGERHAPVGLPVGRR